MFQIHFFYAPLPAKLRWFGSSTWLTATGQRGTRQERRRLNRKHLQVGGGGRTCSSAAVSPFLVVWPDRCHSSAAASSPTPSSPSQDDGGFNSAWVNQQQHQLGTLQSTDQTRREIQEMPSARPPAEDDDDEESECRVSE